MAITVLEAKTEEQPYFYEFKKYEVVGHHPTMANLNYDPFPEANMGDVVRREIIGRQSILHAKLKCDDGVQAMQIRPGYAVEYQGHKFAVESSEIDFESDSQSCTAGARIDVVASEFLTEIEPMKVLARLREMWSTSNSK